MFIFTTILLIASLVGVQIGIYSTLRDKGIPGARSVMYSFGIYLVPILIIMAHVELYRKRHLLFQVYGKEQKLDKDTLNELKEHLDRRYFKVIVLGAALKDIITPKNNIMLLVKISEKYDKKLSIQRKKSSINLFERLGLWGIVKKGMLLTTESFAVQASQDTLFKRYKHP